MRFSKQKGIYRACIDEVSMEWYGASDCDLSETEIAAKPKFAIKKGRYGRQMFFVEIYGTDKELLKKFIKEFNKILDMDEDIDLQRIYKKSLSSINILNKKACQTCKNKYDEGWGVNLEDEENWNDNFVVCPDDVLSEYPGLTCNENCAGVNEIPRWCSQDPYKENT